MAGLLTAEMPGQGKRDVDQQVDADEQGEGLHGVKV